MILFPSASTLQIWIQKHTGGEFSHTNVQLEGMGKEAGDCRAPEVEVKVDCWLIEDSHVYVNNRHEEAGFKCVVAGMVAGLRVVRPSPSRPAARSKGLATGSCRRVSSPGRSRMGQGGHRGPAHKFRGGLVNLNWS